MDFQLTDEQQLIRDTVREFAEKELLPGALDRDINKTFAREQWEAFSALGFAGMTIEEAVRRHAPGRGQRGDRHRGAVAL